VLKKVLIGGAVLLVLVGLGIAYNMRKERRSLFNIFIVDSVDQAVKAVDDDADGAFAQCAFAEQFFETGISYRPWVSQAEYDAQRKRLDDAKAKLKGRYPAKAMVWRLGEYFTGCVVEAQYGPTWEETKPPMYAKCYDYASEYARRLDVPFTISEFEPKYRKATPEAKAKYVADKLAAMTKAVGDKHGEESRKLFTLAATAKLAYYARSIKVPFPDRLAGYPAEIEKLAQETGLPENLWRPFADVTKEEWSPFQMSDKTDKLQSFMDGVSAHLGLPAAKSGGRG
jgi:hypothetical protein